MKKPFTVTMILLLVLTSIVPAKYPGPMREASAYAPPPSPMSIPTPTPPPGQNAAAPGTHSSRLTQQKLTHGKGRPWLYPAPAMMPTNVYTQDGLSVATLLGTCDPNPGCTIPSSNPYSYSCQCTYRAWDLAAAAGHKLPQFGNACAWRQGAINCGYTVVDSLSNDVVNSVAVWGPYVGDAYGAGHVAWVTAVNGNQFYVKERNWAVSCGDSERWVTWVSGISFITFGGGSCDATSIPSGYTKCADEGSRCNFSGTKQVYYGANSCFKVKSFSNGVDCNNNNFGDPAYGTPKACYVEPDSPPSCNPNADQIALFMDTNYGGQCVVKGIGQYSNPGAIGLPNDSISSLKVGSNAKAILCRDDNYSGTCETFTSDDSDLGNNSIGNDQVSSVKVESRTAACNPNADQIALFVHANYGGQCVVKGIGQYSNPGAIGLPNDSISSVKVGDNVKAVLCRDDDYGGGCETFTGDDSHLGDNSIGNDQVSSVKVESRAAACNPSADQIALFVDASYSGQCVVKGIGQYSNPGSIGLPDDSISSVKVGDDVKAILCRDDNYSGGCETFTSDDSNLSDNSIGNDKVSSVKVEAPDTTPPTGGIISPNVDSATNTCPITIQAEVNDDQSGVDRAEFHVWYDGEWHHIGDDNNSPYSIDWDCSSVGDQTVWLTIHAWDNAGNEVMDPGGYVDVILDRVEPTGNIVSPAPDFYIHSDQVDIVATASDDRSGVIGLQFFVWYDDGSGYDWHGLPLDWDGSDGWTSVWDTSGVEDQGSIGFWTYIFDYAGNMGAYSHGGIILDRIPPCVLFGDFTCDCDVDVQDIQEVASRWRMTDTDPDWNPRYDLNGDGIITVVDIMLVSAHWGDTCESLAATLRPSGMKIERPIQPPIPKSIP